MPDLTVLPTLPTAPNSITRPKTFVADADATFAVLPAVIVAWNTNVPVFNSNLTLIASSVLAAAESAGESAAQAQIATEQADIATTKVAEVASGFASLAAAVNAAAGSANTAAGHATTAGDQADEAAHQAGLALAAKNATNAALASIADGPVTSVNQKTGVVVLTPADIGAEPAGGSIAFSLIFGA